VGPTARRGQPGLGGLVFFAILCEGLLIGSDSMVSQEFGAGRVEECFRTLWAGVQFALPGERAVRADCCRQRRLLLPMGIAPEIVRQTIPFLYAMACGLPALMCFAAVRVFLQGTHRVKIVAFAMVSANLINFAGNYALNLRTLGCRRWGLRASGIATTLAAATCCACLLGYLGCATERALASAALMRPLYWEHNWRDCPAGAPAAAQSAGSRSVLPRQRWPLDGWPGPSRPIRSADHRFAHLQWCRWGWPGKPRRGWATPSDAAMPRRPM